MRSLDQNAASVEPPEKNTDVFSIPYRSDIDGLRGIAVIAVVLYHMFPTVFIGGFVGVDIFFVISGFLITSIILNDLGKDRFSFSRFYAHRIRRIFPALLVVVSVAFVFSSGMLLSNEFIQFSKHVAGASVFVSNFVLWGESGYFDAIAETKPLLHLWSLGIEEQFYLLWPFLVWITWRKRDQPLVPLLILLLIVSFCLNVYGVTREPSGTFYSPATRFWELFIGAMLAVIPSTDYIAKTWPNTAPYISFISKPRFKAILASGIACTAVAMLAYSIFGINAGLGFPGWLALVPVFGTACLIGIGPVTWVHRHILQFRGLIWFGLISYPLYLWHWPLLSFSRIVEYQSTNIKLGLIAASVLLAWLTYRFVERPIRFGKKFPRGKIAVLTGLMVAIGIVGLLGSKGLIAPNSDKDVQTLIQDSVWTYKDAPRFKQVSFNPTDFDGAVLLRKNLDQYTAGGSLFFRTIPSASTRKTLYLGDSHMEHFWSRMDQLIQDHPTRTRSAVFITASAFVPIPSVLVNPEFRPHFIGLAQAMLNYAISDKTVDAVVLSANWGAHFVDAASYRAGDESLYYMIVDGKKEHLKAGRRANDLALAGLSDMINTLVKAGKKVYFVHTVPGGGQVTWRRSWGKFELVTTPRQGKEFLRENGSLRPLLSRAAEEAGATVLDPYLTMCPNEVCPGVYDGIHPVYMDGGHVADRYVRKHAVYLDQTLMLD